MATTAPTIAKELPAGGTFVPLATVPSDPGFQGFLCEVTEDPISCYDCLRCAQGGAPGCPMTPAVIEAIVENRRPSNFAMSIAIEGGATFGISVTELLGCPRQHRLKQAHGWYEKPSSLTSILVGQSVHTALSGYTAANALVESRMMWRFTYKAEAAGISPTTVILTGQVDMAEWTADGWLISDYKFSSHPPRASYSYACSTCGTEVLHNITDRRRLSKLFPIVCPSCGALARRDVTEIHVPPQARPSHAVQVNLYALLVQKNAAALADTLKDRGLSVDDPARISGAQLIYLPGPLRCPVSIDTGAAFSLVKQRLNELLRPDLPPILSAREELWECDYCPVRYACEREHGGPVGTEAVGGDPAEE